jgi:hypothetical protein
MKALMIASLVLLVSVPAFAQLENSIGIFFSDMEFTAENTNFDPVVAVPFDAWIVLLNPTVDTVGAYEASFTVDPSLLAVGVGGPNGWTNFGTPPFNHLVGYQVPVPAFGEDVVLGFFGFLYLVGTPSEIYMGPSEPSSVGGAGPAITDGANPEILLVCNYTSGPDFGGLVATLYGTGIDFPVPVESRSLSGVKALFD